jgi:hypothetical protein
MPLLLRVLVVLFALIIAFMAVGLAIAAALWIPAVRGYESDAVDSVMFYFAGFFIAGFAGMTALLPAIIAVAIAEGFDFRSFLYYAAAGAVVALIAFFTTDIGVRLEETTDIAPVTLGPQLVVAGGIIGGIAYWLVAGRNAGKWKARM